MLYKIANALSSYNLLQLVLDFFKFTLITKAVYIKELKKNIVLISYFLNIILPEICTFF